MIYCHHLRAKTNNQVGSETEDQEETKVAEKCPYGWEKVRYERSRIAEFQFPIETLMMIICIPSKNS